MRTSSRSEWENTDIWTMNQTLLISILDSTRKKDLDITVWKGNWIHLLCSSGFLHLSLRKNSIIILQLRRNYNIIHQLRLRYTRDRCFDREWCSSVPIIQFTKATIFSICINVRNMNKSSLSSETLLNSNYHIASLTLVNQIFPSLNRIQYVHFINFHRDSKRDHIENKFFTWKIIGQDQSICLLSIEHVRTIKSLLLFLTTCMLLIVYHFLVPCILSNDKDRLKQTFQSHQQYVSDNEYWESRLKSITSSKCAIFDFPCTNQMLRNIFVSCISKK